MILRAGIAVILLLFSFYVANGFLGNLWAAGFHDANSAAYRHRAYLCLFMFPVIFMAAVIVFAQGMRRRKR